MVKEVGLGIGSAVIIYLLYQGINLFPALFLVGIVYYLYTNLISGKGNKFAKNLALKNKTDIKFSDIGGQKIAKKELLEALDFVKDKTKIKSLGIRPLKGILLAGPPGTGKTLLAKAAANYIDSVFLNTSGSDFVEMYAGVGSKRVRKLFAEAKKKAQAANKDNAVIFIDEIDILGSKRGASSNHMEYDQTLNQLLVEMDGISIEQEVNILLIAATNRMKILDKALLRPGRFDRIVKVNLPDKEGREEILKIHTKNKPLSSEVDLKELANKTFQFSGAHLECLTNEAAIMALRTDEVKITNHHFEEAIDKVIMGEKLNRAPDQSELKRIALHEIGHALLSEVLDPGSVASITIVSRGNALGYVRHNEADNYYLHTAEYLKNKIAILIAGSMVEEILLGNKSTGATNDFEKAIQVAQKIVFAGLSELGVVSNKNLPKSLLYKTVTRIIRSQENKVRKIIEQNQDFIKELVHKLLDVETISGQELRLIFADEMKNDYEQLKLVL